jgi:hypothetical protein
MLTHAEESNFQRALGWDRELLNEPSQRDHLRSYIILQLASAGLSPPQDGNDRTLDAFSGEMLESLREKSRLLAEHRAPIDQRIERFLASYFDGVTVAGEAMRLPSNSLTLDRHGMARELSLPSGGNSFENELVKSYRCHNGVLNNPRSDRRTTAGTFHIVEGGPLVPGDKKEVPKQTFVHLFRAAMKPPKDLMRLPYTSNSLDPAHTWVSLMLRPLVRPRVEQYAEQKSLETRFFAPASLVSNLDFVESIFGNAGDPMVPSNDAGIDVRCWSGHTGCVILAPHLTTRTKKQLDLPHYEDATERQRADGMCWKDESEIYNDGSAFKLTCRDTSGTIVTLIADNYYGYCKKEVKTQISFAANLMGGVEEEHAGGALAFASYSLGEEFQVNSRRYNGRTFEQVAADYGSIMDLHEEGYGVDLRDPTVYYIPENALATLDERCIKWERNGKTVRLPLSPKNIYIAPSGYKIRLEKHPSAPSWRLVGTVGEGIFCHKPCTVSGGGKSEISKSLRDYMLFGPIYVGDAEADFAKLDEIFSREYSTRWRTDYEDKPKYEHRDSRSVLAQNRSVGSVIQLLTPQPLFSEEYNTWLESISNRVYAMALIIKRFVRPGMESNWRAHFGVDIVNGSPGHELKMGKRALVGTYLRIGVDDSNWRTFKLRQDFIAAAKVQREDDISASVVVPAEYIDDVGKGVQVCGSYKFVENCEFRLFQRPDDAVHRGLDNQTEWDLSRPSNFISNFEPLTREQAMEMVNDVIDFEKFSEPMQDLILDAAYDVEDKFVVSSDRPRLIDGVPSKNPRYLQDRPDLINWRDTYVAMRGTQLHRALPVDSPIHMPVGAILGGRRNNPPDKDAGIRSLAVYSPLHYQELPELIMDWVCSLTGKSPSTTGAGTEGAMTKRPFNALCPAIDMNAAIVSMIVTGLGGFSTAAGFIGPKLEVGHDISLLIPEVWCRMGPEERDPKALLANGMLEKIEDFEFEGRLIPASRLGYRITRKFVRTYMARVFDNPAKVFPEEILQPEKQDLDSFADGIEHIAEAQQKVAQQYFDDQSYELACPPLKAVLSIMATGKYEGEPIDSPAVRVLFSREYLLESDWYNARLNHQVQRDVAFWSQTVEHLKSVLKDPMKLDAKELCIAERLEYAEEELATAKSPEYLESLVGTLGLDPNIAK